MDEADLAAQLSQLLGEELADRIPDLNGVLLAIERAPSDLALARELHRLIHVVKGASRSAGMIEIEAACHELETLLAAVEPGTEIPASTIARGVTFADQLEQARKQLVAGQPVTLAAQPVDSTETPERDTSMRVAADDLDLLMGHSAAVLIARQRLTDPIRVLGELDGELSQRRVLSAAQLASSSRRLSSVHRELLRALSRLDTTSARLDEHVRRLRLRSIADASRGCERTVHDTAAATGKRAELFVQGGEVRVDRAQIEVLRDVLIQIVRNSVAHGIELPEVRALAGKPELGRITIEAHIEGDAVRVTVSDDGGGLDLDAIKAQSARRGMRIESIADAERAIFAPGLSTAASVTELAGRGVGLDVAKQRIEAMHGSITVASERGHHTTFTIELPTTVATITAMVISCAGVAYAIPSASVDRAVRIARVNIRHAEGRSLVRIGETWMPLGILATVLGKPAPAMPERAAAIVLIQGGRRVALAVDGIVGIFDLVIGALDARLGRIRHLTGQARLATGNVALVVNASDLIDDVLGMTVTLPAATAMPTKRPKILVVDDSATTRALEANILRTAGYEVIVAVDGQAALRQLSEHPHVDLIVSDIDMPNLDGFGLTQAVRGNDRIATLPVVLVTARGTDEDRARGLRVGANAYLVKSSFDQTVLLQTIARLL
ncbi:MAG TPA: response regulator [Kofleriaceae bacterium]|nr:response regulator [Kofleriaceae bacterium]